MGLAPPASDPSVPCRAAPAGKFGAKAGQSLALRPPAEGGPAVVVRRARGPDAVSTDELALGRAAAPRPGGRRRIAGTAALALPVPACPAARRARWGRQWPRGRGPSPLTGSRPTRAPSRPSRSGRSAGGVSWRRGRGCVSPAGSSGVCGRRRPSPSPATSSTPRPVTSRRRAWPERFLQRNLTTEPGVTVEVWDEHQIADERLGGLLGVSRGSLEPPRLVRAHYSPSKPKGGGWPGSPCGAGRQGHHLRLRRTVAQVGGRHDHHEDRHERAPPS